MEEMVGLAGLSDLAITLIIFDPFLGYAER